MTQSRIAAIYDFELFPYALGDVLTWNVRTAMRCEELGRECVDIYICVDQRYPAGIYQRGLVNEGNFELFFSELYSAFATHPHLGDIHIYRDRDSLLERLLELAHDDPVNAEAVHDYLEVLKYQVVVGDGWASAAGGLVGRVRRSYRVRRMLRLPPPRTTRQLVRSEARPTEEALNSYFIKYIHSHEAINEFAAKFGRIPLLQPAPGCSPDVDELMAKRLAGKLVVPFHLRLRRLDAGYGGEHSYPRDSDFLEWYDFLRKVGDRYPNVAFIALGRLQEKPIELLRLPNITSLRVFGLGLGHELSLMARSDLFIGTSSGFAAFANFSSLPHFITKMNSGSCHAYAIPDGADRLPFAKSDQILIYEQETSDLLMRLLETGLGERLVGSNTQGIENRDPAGAVVDVGRWLASRAQPANSAATTFRFFIDDKYRLEETAYLILPALERARNEWAGGRVAEAESLMTRMMDNFDGLLALLPQFWLLRGGMAAEAGDTHLLRESIGRLAALGAGMDDDMRLLSECMTVSRDHTDGDGSKVNPIGILRDRICNANFDVVAA